MSISAAAEEAIFLYESVVRGHHVYKSVWSPFVGEVLDLSCEASNPYDDHAVCVTKSTSGGTVGHVPRTISRSFLSEGGVISCEITGPRQYGRGLEVPCIYKLSEEEALVIKAKEKLLKIKNI